MLHIGEVRFFTISKSFFVIFVTSYLVFFYHSLDERAHRRGRPAYGESGLIRQPDGRWYELGRDGEVLPTRSKIFVSSLSVYVSVFLCFFGLKKST